MVRPTPSAGHLKLVKTNRGILQPAVCLASFRLAACRLSVALPPRAVLFSLQADPRGHPLADSALPTALRATLHLCDLGA